MPDENLVYDVIVVGAGPAGSLAAYHLANNHQRVLLLDQQTFPRYKPCGGGIPMRTIKELPFDLKPVLECCALGAILTYKGESRMKARLEGEFAWLTMRDKMDQFLLEKAVEAGAQCLAGVRVLSTWEEDHQVLVKTSAQSFRAKYLIGADGVNSIVARSHNLLPNRRTGVALEAEVGVPSKALLELGAYAAFDFGAVSNGYGWIFPKSDHLSVGVFQAKPEKARNLKECLQAFIQSHPILKQNEILHLQGHRIPLGGSDEPLHTKRCLLVGDAANLADPWLGEGIFYAVRSAALAAQVLGGVLQSGENDLAAYSLRIRNEILLDFNYSRRIANLVYRYPDFATTLISRSRVMQNDVFLNIRGDISFRQLWRRLIVKFPTILTQTLFFRGER